MNHKTNHHDQQLNNTLDRRSFLKTAAQTITFTSIIAALNQCDSHLSKEEFFQKHFKSLSPDQLEKTIKRLETQYQQKYGKSFSISTKAPIDNTLFAYALDISRCIGCRRCVYACVKENNQSLNPQVHWIQVLEMEKEKGIDLIHSNLFYDHKEVPDDRSFYLPVQCQQCKNPPCVKSCPVKATWQEPDGIVVVDYNWCIGCRCCMSACPYGARHFNWAEPGIPSKEIKTQTHYLGNRPRYKGMVEKCTFCIQRVREGLYPACVEICPVGARKFGNLLDPKNEIRYILENKRVFILKEELNTQPKFYYFFAT